jgi:hypothetical protein
VRSAAVVLPQAEAFLDAAREDVKVRPGQPVTSV